MPIPNGGRCMREPSGKLLKRGIRKKHDTIIKAAGRLFLKHGYTHTSMDDVAAKAGVSKQTVYSYFTSKELLFRRLIEELCNLHTPPESMIANSRLSCDQTLLKFGYGFMGTISSPTGIGVHRVVMAESPQHPRVAEIFFQSGPEKMQSMLENYLRKQVDAGRFKINNIERAASHFFSMIKGWHQMRMVLNIKPLPTKKELDEHVRDSVRAFCMLYSNAG